MQLKFLICYTSWYRSNKNICLSEMLIQPSCFLGPTNDLAQFIKKFKTKQGDKGPPVPRCTKYKKHCCEKDSGVP